MQIINRYTPNEILNIFQARYLQAQVYDPEVDSGQELTFETTISEWIDICDLVETYELHSHLNRFFDLDIPVEDWLLVLAPRDKKTLGDLCDFIAAKTIKPSIPPVKLFGSDCQHAATFRYLMRRFENKGIDVGSIKPSSQLEPFSKKNFPTLIEEVHKLNPCALPPVDFKRNLISSFGINLFLMGFITLLVSIWVSNLTWIIVGQFTTGIITVWIGSLFSPAKVSFNGIERFRDLIIRINDK